MIRQPFKARTSEELIALLSAVATAILAFIIITTLYFGREIFVPIALAILLSFVLAPLVGVLQRIRMPRGLAVVSVVIIAFALIFAMGSLLATQLTQLAGDLPRYQCKELEKPKKCGHGHRFNPEYQGCGISHTRSGGSTPARSERP